LLTKAVKISSKEKLQQDASFYPWIGFKVETTNNLNRICFTLLQSGPNEKGTENRNNMEKILIIDDDVELCTLLVEYLNREEYNCSVENNGTSGQNRVLRERFDLVILDVMLPGTNGLDVLRTIRQTSQVPVLMLTARGEESDRITGLELGSDDYLAKPFNPRELLARIKAILRRYKSVTETTSPGKKILESVGIRLDPFSRTVYLYNRPKKLTSLEFDFLEALMKKSGEVVTREDLSQEVLDRDFSPLDRSIDVHIGQLRKKIGLREDGEPRIKTVRGIGYIFGTD
jgi:two-component system, OmpR family, response regulator CpxR